MSGWQRSRATFVTVVFLLSFTALDLLGDTVAYPFCASDLESAPPSEDEGLTTNESDESIPSDVHIDDCFCCSRCVHYSTPFVFAPIAPVRLNDSEPPVSFGLLLPHELYRPPRLS